MGKVSRMIDPRWHWIRAALEALYAEIEPADVMLGMAIQVGNPADKTVMVYQMMPGSNTISRHLITDTQAAADCIVPGVVDATPDPGVTDG